ncbi:MAG: carboxymuconolactone decarboxylase family protein [Isosphaeraceae bacterium]
MRFSLTSLSAAMLALAIPVTCPADDKPASATPPPVASTRTELKELLERSKQSHPRLPLPPPTEQELAAAKARAGRGPMTGVINNGRMRKLYLPAEVLGGGFSREPDPTMTLNNTFKTMFFWIVSRANNCTYCQGHQEVKLAGDGVNEETRAALDGDWSEFSPSERAAFAFTLKLTTEPNRISDADIDRLRRHYNDLQILEIITAVGGFNAMNRWTGALAIPQEGHREYLTPTPEKYKAMRSRVAPLPDEATSSAPVCAKPANRGPLETRAQVEAALDACRKRSPRLPLALESQARASVPADWSGASPLPEWVRLLANFPKGGRTWIAQTYHSETKGRLGAKLKAEIAYIAARNDRAWYALGHARHRLARLGMNDEAIDALDHPGGAIPEGERLALALARKLTVNPALITDEDIAGLRKHYPDPEVAEIVYHVTQAAFFDRLTEAAGLRLEE